MNTHWMERVAGRISSERFDIARRGDAYMTRYTLAGRRYDSAWLGGRAVYLHQFHRGDNDDALHDHPWPFVSLILAGGYWEHTPRRDGSVGRRWYGPGRILVRPAHWRHRVELAAGRPCWSLVARGVKAKSWSFFCLSAAGRLTGKAVPWREFIDNVEAGALGCGDSA